MLEIIIFIIIIVAITNKTKRNKDTTRQTPPIAVPPAPKKAPLSSSSVTKQVNKQIFGTENTRDRVTVYNRLILTDRYQDMEKMAHELGISKYQVLREIQDLKKEGHYSDIQVNERNYRLIYPALVKKTAAAPKKAPLKPAKAEASAPSAPKPPVIEEEERTFIEPTKPYRPARNAGERYEEWMPVPEGKEVVHCSYCGADNLIPKRASAKNFTCYFCREEL